MSASVKIDVNMFCEFLYLLDIPFYLQKVYLKKLFGQVSCEHPHTIYMDKIKIILFTFEAPRILKILQTSCSSNK
jgi:hypothetical protein